MTGSPIENVLEEAEALIKKGASLEAARLLDALVAQGRGGLLLRLQLVRARIGGGDVAGALSLARDVALSNSQVADAALALGEALKAAQLLPTAIAEFQRALRLDPRLDRARLALAASWLDAGEPERAEEALAPLEPMDDVAALLRQAAYMRSQDRSDAGYVRHLFDQFSVDYDARMRGQLAYRAPEILRDLANLVVPLDRKLRILDFGCGTGLAGMAFRDVAIRLDGIDLSPAMIERAKERGVYDALLIGDLERPPAVGQYDLVVAADTLVYLGDLSLAFAAAHACLVEGGHFLFTVERGEGDSFAKGPKRRWLHAQTYLRALARQVGFDIVGLLDCQPRMEAGKPVEGFAAALRNL